MNWYLWESTLGSAVACAGSVEHARSQLLAQTVDGSERQANLQRVIQESPRVIPPDRAFAMFALNGHELRNSLELNRPQRSGMRP
ncbi:MAG: hypothetical protein O9327_05915 [Polaromonas sp.]|nr:hypothetical protein [Polaromonas sp.]